MSTKKLTKLYKVLIIVTMISIICMTFTSAVFAVDNDPSQYKGTDTEIGGIQNIGNQLITIISTIGSIASVIVLIVLGIKYMMGSAEEKAEYKKTLLPYVIGAGLVFAASAIAGIVYNFTNQLSGT